MRTPLSKYDMLSVDLHSHSTVSDGLLSPTELVSRAAGRGVRLLALTDHDGVGGVGEAARAASGMGMGFVPGVEVSVTWRNHTIHVVGLGIDVSNAVLVSGLESVRSGRQERARRIAESLARVGVGGAYDGALALAGNPNLVSRTHFARFLVGQGRAPDVKRVFKRYLSKGKPGYVSHRWAALSDALNWIAAAGGMAILAHPGRYDIGETTLRALLGEFKDLGGAGIEVVSGAHTPQQFAKFAADARAFGLLASAGSDFHGPGESFFDLGQLPDLPPGCDPVWSEWWTEPLH
jgi:3',5'-nucleoside bisphosphate phosphatase